MPRLLALNLNHRTRPVPISRSLVDGLVSLRPDIVIFNEFIDQEPAIVLRRTLEDGGLPFSAISDSVEYRPGRWHNQVLIASNKPILSSAVPNDGPDDLSRTNTLSVRTHEMLITGLRVPAYTRADDWYRYWEWLNSGLVGDVAIGDFNADPGRNRKWDRVLHTLMNKGKWSLQHIDGEWSYRGSNGSMSKVDHVLTRGGLRVTQACYVVDTFVTTNTDHAAILADIEKPDDNRGHRPNCETP